VTGPDDVVEELRRAGVARGQLLGLAIAPGVGVGLGVGLATAAGGSQLGVPATAVDPVAVVAAVEDALRPRWVWWSSASAVPLVEGGVRVATFWDVAAVHRLVAGGWAADPARAWATLHDLPLASIPATGPVDLFTVAERAAGERSGPVRDDGHLEPDWLDGGWARSPARLAAWAQLAARAAVLQDARLRELVPRPCVAVVARSESTAELLGVELAADGLPVDRAVAERLVADVVGPRPASEAEATEQRLRRDADVLRHVPGAERLDLRSAGQVRSLLRRVGIELPDTRAWRLEPLRDEHPVVAALLAWRKAERVATTYGYAWLDGHVGADGRLRGSWTGSDGGAGRMTASTGLHNLPAELRPAVRAEPGHVLVRADLGQIEPRVLAVVSGDRALAAATRADDLYAPVARELGVDRPTAKVAVLGAMYGQTAGRGGDMRRRLTAAYPIAMAYLDEADQAARSGRPLRTYGGRAVPTGSPSDDASFPADEARRRAAARGRYGRNAIVQGAAAELFKLWAVTVRARAAAHGARIVLCLHDELLVHAPVSEAAATAQLVEDALQEAVARWAPDDEVRFVVEVSVLDRWSDAKG
jgi:DNA polymerase-1